MVEIGQPLGGVEQCLGCVAGNHRGCHAAERGLVVAMQLYDDAASGALSPH